MIRGILALILVICSILIASAQKQVHRSIETDTKNKTSLDDLELDPRNTLETIYVLEFKEDLVSKALNCYKVGEKPFKVLPDHPTLVVPNHQPEIKIRRPQIISRSKPGPSEKNPTAPIKELSIYPNPSFGDIQIELTYETLQLSLFDMLGHNLGDIPFQEVKDEQVSVDLSYLPAGTYVLQLRHEQGTDVAKLIIVNN